MDCDKGICVHTALECVVSLNPDGFVAFTLFYLPKCVLYVPSQKNA